MSVMFLFYYAIWTEEICDYFRGVSTSGLWSRGLWLLMPPKKETNDAHAAEERKNYLDAKAVLRSARTFMGPTYLPPT
jgi:hypothetical protein